MDASGCMKSLLLAATQYRTAKTPPNAALLQRGLEVRAAPGRGSRAAAGVGRGGRACSCGRGVPSGLWARAAFSGPRPGRPQRGHGAAGVPGTLHRGWLQAPGAAGPAWPAASPGAQRLEMGTLACCPAGRGAGGRFSVQPHLRTTTVYSVIVVYAVCVCLRKHATCLHGRR